jgi:hypothetical protein
VRESPTSRKSSKKKKKSNKNDNVGVASGASATKGKSRNTSGSEREDEVSAEVSGTHSTTKRKKAVGSSSCRSRRVIAKTSRAGGKTNDVLSNRSNGSKNSGKYYCLT